MTEYNSSFHVLLKRPPVWPLAVSLVLFLLLYIVSGFGIALFAATLSIKGAIALALLGAWVILTVRDVRRLLQRADSIHVSADGLTIEPNGKWSWEQIRSFELDKGFVNVEAHGQRRSFDLQRRRMTASEWAQFVDVLIVYRPECTASWQEQLKTRGFA